MTLLTSLLPLSGLLNKINEENVCNCLVNSQLQTHLPMNYQICLGVVVTCDSNIATDITLMVQHKLKYKQNFSFSISSFCKYLLSTVSYSRDQEIKSTSLHSILSPARWKTEQSRPIIYIQCDDVGSRIIDITFFVELTYQY